MRKLQNRVYSINALRNVCHDRKLSFGFGSYDYSCFALPEKIYEKGKKGELIKRGWEVVGKWESLGYNQKTENFYVRVTVVK